MAENQLPIKGDAPVLVPSESSSTSGTSELRPFSLGRASSSSNLSSLTVPVRLDVLYFLLNSAAKGAQSALAPLPVHSGQGSVSACHCPVAVQAVNCCNSCHSTSRHASDSVPYTRLPSGLRHDETACGNYGHHERLSPGIPDRQDNKWVRVAQQSEGKSRSGSLQADSARGWKRSQSPLGWKEKQRDEGGRHGKRDNWQGKQMNFRKAWDNRRESLAGSAPWNSGCSSDRRREGRSSFGVPSVNIKNRDGSSWQATCSAPEDRRHLAHTRIGWQKSQGTHKPASFVDKTGAAEPTNTTGQDKREDWEAEYENAQETSSAPESISVSSFQSKKIDTSKAGGSYDGECAPSPDPPKQKLETSPLPMSVSKDQATTSPKRELTKFPSGWSKNGKFSHYLRGLYSDMSGKPSSESSTDLVISTDAESSKPAEEEEAAKSAAGGESSPWAEAPSSAVSLTSVTSLETNLSFLTQPLKITSGICSAGSLLLEYMSLSTSYWVLETTHQGMVHSGLWRICLDPKCKLYQFNLLALHVHVTRAFLLSALLCGLVGLVFICIAFERKKLYDVSVIRVAAIFSFTAGVLILVAMSLFTAIFRRSPAYAQHLLVFGSSFSLGWASILMYFITGMLLLLTDKTIIS